MNVDTSKWSGEGEFTQSLIEELSRLDGIELVRVEDAPSSRSDADYNFISNEVYVGFSMTRRRLPVRRLGILPGVRTFEEKAMTLSTLEKTLSDVPSVGAPDYSDEGMLQYLKAERIVPPYQTRGYKLVELVRVYELVTLHP